MWGTKNDRRQTETPSISIQLAGYFRDRHGVGDVAVRLNAVDSAISGKPPWSILIQRCFWMVCIVDSGGQAAIQWATSVHGSPDNEMQQQLTFPITKATYLMFIPNRRELFTKAVFTLAVLLMIIWTSRQRTVRGFDRG